MPLDFFDRCQRRRTWGWKLRRISCFAFGLLLHQMTTTHLHTKADLIRVPSINGAWPYNCLRIRRRVKGIGGSRESAVRVQRASVAQPSPLSRQPQAHEHLDGLTTLVCVIPVSKRRNMRPPDFIHFHVFLVFPTRHGERPWALIVGVSKPRVSCVAVPNESALLQRGCYPFLNMRMHSLTPVRVFPRTRACCY